MKLRLSDVDRARFGGDEWLEWDSSRLAYDEAEQLQELLGVKFTAYPEFLKSGEARGVRWALWLSLQRAGVDVAWDDFKPELMGVRVLREPPGKDTPSIPPSPFDSDESTTPPP